jgi:hypothetical protein
MRWAMLPRLHESEAFPHGAVQSGMHARSESIPA